MHSLLQDLRFATRALAASPGFTVVAVVTLALGIGASSAVFSTVNGLLWRPLPVRESHRLVALFGLPGPDREPSSFSYLNYLDLQRESAVFSGVIAQTGTPLSLSTGERAEMAWGEMVTPNYFSVLGVDAALGRMFGPEDDHGVGSAPYAVLSHAFWQSRFGADPGVVGQAIRLNGHPFTIVGVAPPRFTETRLFLFLPDVWVPFPMHPQVIPGSEGWLTTNRGARTLILMARLGPGTTPKAAQAATSALAQKLAAEQPPGEVDPDVLLMPGGPPFVDPAFVPRSALASWAGLGLGGVGLVLLVACANVASLLLARGTARRREVAIRVALGASRGRLVRLLLSEALLLSLAGGSLGLLLATWSTGFQQALIPPSPFRLGFEVGVDHRVLVFTLAASVLATVLAGLAPTLHASRADVLPALKGDVPAGPARGLPVRSALVVAQLAVSLVLVVAGGLFLKSLGQAREMDVGFRTEGGLMLTVNPGVQGYDEARGRDLLRRLLDRARALPAVSRATLAYPLPLDFSTYGTEVEIEGREAPPEAQRIPLMYSIVDAGYFETLGTPIVNGRAFSEQDRAGSFEVAIVNETMARYWPGADPVGRRLRVAGSDRWVQVVGVARDGKYAFIREDPRPYLYLPLGQNYASPMTLVVRAADPRAIAGTLRQEVASLDPDLPVSGVMTLEEFMRRPMSAAETGASLSTVFGLLALVLAAVGLFGAVSYAAARRTHEMGLRMALGAARGDILRLILAGSLRLGVAGVVLGLAAAAATARVLSGTLYGVEPRDPLVFGLAPALLLGVVLLAGLIPALRAARVDPMVALRRE